MKTTKTMKRAKELKPASLATIRGGFLELDGVKTGIRSGFLELDGVKTGF